MTILEEICANEIVDLHLSLVPEEYFGETTKMVEALRDNTSIVTVKFDKEFIACIYGIERREILDQLTELPNLKEVFLGDAGLMVDLIAELLGNAKSLRKLSLSHLVLQGAKSDFDALEAAVHRHGSLKEFEMEDCIAPNEDIDITKLVHAAAGKNFKATNIEDPLQAKKSAIAA
jgi:hypothetical protein